MGRLWKTMAGLSRRRLQFRLLTLVVLVGLSACLFAIWRAVTASEPARVSGIVTYQGQPVASGVIQFQPLDPGGTKASASVVHGKYTVEEGLLPGTYAVSIRDSRNALPAKYYQPMKSSLRARIVGTKTTTLHFDLR